MMDDAGELATAATLPKLAQATTLGERVGRYRWVICGLLFFATTVNYVDRQVLGMMVV